MQNLSFETVAFLVPAASGAIIRILEGPRKAPRFGRISIVAVAYSALLLIVSNWSLLTDFSAGNPSTPHDTFYAIVGSIGLLGISFFMLVGAYSFTGRIAGWLSSNNNQISEQDAGGKGS